jgi:hypothetical protein
MGFLSSLFGSSKSKPATTTNVISQKLPEEIAPFAKEVLGEAQQLYKANIERGYDPFTGQTIAPFTPEQQRSMEGIAGLVGTSKPLQEEALATYRQGAEKFTGDTAQQYMSPYQQAVTDIEKREAQRNFEGNVLPRLEAQAVQQGAMSGLGSRAGVEMAEAQRNQAQLLADIQAKGQQAAFQDARQGFEQQKAREKGMASDLSRLGPAMFATGLQEQGALGAVGEQKQQLAQSALDEAYFKFLEEEQYPQQQLANYSGFVYGNPAAGLIQQTGTGTSTPFQPSFGQTLLGLGSGLGSAFLGSPGGSKAVANLFSKEGGKVSEGLSGLVEKQEGGTVDETGFQEDFRTKITEPLRRGFDEDVAERAVERNKFQNMISYFTDPINSPEVQARKQELAKARQVLQNLSPRKEPPKSVETETPPVPTTTAPVSSTLSTDKVKPPVTKTTKELTAEDYKREGVRPEEDILKRASEMIKEKEDIAKEGTEYNLAAAGSDVAAYFARRWLTGESSLEDFDNSKKERNKLNQILKKVKLKNVDVRKLAEDLGYTSESRLKTKIMDRISKIINSKLSTRLKLLNLSKVSKEIKQLDGVAYNFSNIEAKERETVALGIMNNLHTKVKDPEIAKLLKPKIEQLSSDEKKAFANEILYRSDGNTSSRAILSDIIQRIMKTGS